MKYLIIALLLLPNVYSWNYETHQNIAVEIASNLNLSLNSGKVAEGAIAPDKEFKDVVNHHYPVSYEKAIYWLKKSKSSHSQGNLEQSSYEFGVASHYITDSFADPHYISKESSYEHSKYEDRGYYRINSKCNIYSDNLEELLSSASQESLWKEWLSTHSSSIPESRIEQASQALYSASILELNASCKKEDSTVLIISAIGSLLILSLLAFRFYRK